MSMQDQLDALMKALEAGGYGGHVNPELRPLLLLLEKLDVVRFNKTQKGWPIYEPLQATLKTVTYDMKDLKLWKDIIQSKKQK